FTGTFAGQQNATGTGNTFTGFEAGYNNTTGNNNIYIGNLGPASGAESSTIRIGGDIGQGYGPQTATYIVGIYGVNVGGVPVQINSNGQLGAQTSSLRFKEQVRDMGDSTSALMKLRPVTFLYKPEYDKGERTLQYGLIAEEVAKVYPDLIEEELSIRFGLSLIGVPQQFHDFVVQRWAASGKKSIGDFAPYFRHMFSVDLFFHLSIAADLISRVRPAGKADNKVDIAYLYYVPFRMIFVSNDKLHERVVPLFLRNDQTFVKGPDVKADLRKIDEHFDKLPDEVKSKDLFKFASELPEGDCPLIVQLWDKHLPTWRKQKAEHKPLLPDMQK